MIQFKINNYIMKYLFLIISILVITNLSAQTKIINSTGGNYTKSGLKKIKRVINQDDINRLNLETKIVGKTALPALYRFKNKQLILNGAGLRELLWIDVYACGLYMISPEVNPLNVINKNEMMIVRMDILSKAVSHKKLVSAFKKGFEDGNDEAVVKKLNWR